MSHWNHNCLGFFFHWVEALILQVSIVSGSLFIQANRKWFSPRKQAPGTDYLPWQLTLYPSTFIWQVKMQRIMTQKKRSIEISLWDPWLRAGVILTTSGQMLTPSVFHSHQHLDKAVSYSALTEREVRDNVNTNECVFALPWKLDQDAKKYLNCFKSHWGIKKASILKLVKGNPS